MATRPDAVRVFAPAKINLFLHVVRKRPDGYHDLQSLVAFADVGDALVVARDAEFSLAIDGPFAGGLSGEPDNLVLKAARALSAHLAARGGARFRLTKNLPVASGIGGGSADAAAAIRGLLALWDRGSTVAGEIAALAAGLGSDTPVCLASSAAWMEGRGERVTLLPPLPPMHMVLVNPGIAIATGDVFRRLEIQEGRPPLAPSAAFASAGEFVDYLRTTRNDLEAPAYAIAPVIGTVLDALLRNGALMARMSGSGATCFGLFETAAQASAAAATITKSQPAWWVRAGGFASVDAGEAQAMPPD